jgi:hypothetical protein
MTALKGAAHQHERGDIPTMPTAIRKFVVPHNAAARKPVRSGHDRRRELLLIVADAFVELAALEPEPSADEVYSSRSLPPDLASRAAFARACRSIPEARRHGKVWRVSRAVWERARAPRRSERARSRDDIRAVLGLARGPVCS